MSDLSEETSRILAYDQIITWEGVVFCQGHIKVISKSSSQKILKIPLLVVQSSTRKDWWWHILGRVSFQNTFWGNLWTVLILGGVIPPCLPLLHPLHQGSIEQEKYNYAAVCSISLGFHRKRLIHNWEWRLTWVEVVLYCMDTAQTKHEGYIKVM